MSETFHPIPPHRLPHPIQWPQIPEGGPREYKGQIDGIWFEFPMITSPSIHYPDIHIRYNNEHHFDDDSGWVVIGIRGIEHL